MCWVPMASCGARSTIAALHLLIMAAAARADDAPESWFFLPVYEGPITPAPSAIVAPWQQALGSVIDNTTRSSAARFAESHSAPAENVPSAQLAELTRAVNRAERESGMFQAEAAEDALRPVRALSTGAMDVFTRSARAATALQNICLMRATRLQRCGSDQLTPEQLDWCLEAEQRERGSRLLVQHRVRTCLEDFPGLAAVDWDVSEIGPTFRAARDEVDAARVASVTLGNKDCSVQYNGMPVGRSPLTIAARPGAARVQLTCAGVPTRVHSVDVRAGAQTVEIDPVFDAAVVAGEAGLALRYTTATLRSARAQKDGAVIGRALRVEHVVLLLVDRNAVRLVPIGTEHLLTASPSVAFANARYDQKALAAAAKTLEAARD